MLKPSWLLQKGLKPTCNPFRLLEMQSSFLYTSVEKSKLYPHSYLLRCWLGLLLIGWFGGGREALSPPSRSHPLIPSILAHVFHVSQDKVRANGFPWKRIESNWKKREKIANVELYTQETGGSGDCLFYSIAAALKQAKYYNAHQKTFQPASLRSIVATQFVGWDCEKASQPPDNWDANEFLSKLEVLCSLENDNCDVWPDLWSPCRILNHTLYKNSQGQYMNVANTHLKAQAVHFELRQCGHTHWGTGLDIGLLEEALNIGIILLHSKNGQIYPHGSITTQKRDLYILLYYIDSVHFQLSGISFPKISSHQNNATLQNGKHSTEPYCSLWQHPHRKEPISSFTPEQLPKFLKQWYQEDCKHAIFPEDDTQS